MSLVPPSGSGHHMWDDIKPIPTRYAGCHFRSRLEARWAVFFDHLDIGWQYEPQGYVINNVPYLPDFSLHLPSNRTLFVEVKPAGTNEHEGEHIDLCRGLARDSGRNILLLIGIPEQGRLYHQFFPELASGEFTAAFFHDYGSKLTTADEYWFQFVTCHPETGTLQFTHDDRAYRKSFGPGLIAAITAARSARFEHGQSGRT